jgi:SNF2 family DNA or RNA helicase
MLDLIGTSLEEHQIAFLRIDGSLTEPKRAKILFRFSNNDSARVLITTTRSTGVGVNLTCACKHNLTSPRIFGRSLVECQR